MQKAQDYIVCSFYKHSRTFNVRCNDTYTQEDLAGKL